MGYYKHNEIEQKWQRIWKEKKTFVIDKNTKDRPKYYVLDMFPYPSGSGLHVGHPLGYIATDIIARFKRAKGFNVLHPMGFDAFGLPAEQYAIQMGVHPSVTTRENTRRYWEQMQLLGFSYDPDCVFNTSDPNYYKWTQWIFLQLFQHYYCKDSRQARPISELIAAFEQAGNTRIHAATSQRELFTAENWNAFTEKEKHDILMHYRLAYISDGYVNWCADLGTVLANDEVKDGRSERGGYPVERRKMPQWMLRITAYAERLLEGLETVDFPEQIKTQQENWIGKSEGGMISYAIEGSQARLEIFTTRPDTIFGNTYMVIAPEHELVESLTTDGQREVVSQYVEKAKNRSERERQSDTTKTGVFTGSYCLHPFTGERLPIWISDYVLVGYGTGAIMAVPAHDERDYEFAHKFQLPIKEVVGGGDIRYAAHVAKEGIMLNSDFLNGLRAYDAIPVVLNKLEEKGIGKRQITYRMRDAIWSRQRYWGEPTPVKIKDGMYFPVDEQELPITLPNMADFQPTGSPESPLAKVSDWVNREDGFRRETLTMPGAAGSSWYFLRYFDRDNDNFLCDKAKAEYWMPVDLYMGGAEHAVGHLLYSRFWTKFLKDLGHISVEEPYSRLVNQGMIQGTSAIMYRDKQSNVYYSADMVNDPDKYSQIHVNVNHVRLNVLDVDRYKEWSKEANAVFRYNESGEFKTDPLVEKMSKRFYNTIDPADICQEYGADTLRLYEMFLGPIEASKPWNTEGIEGIVRFMRKIYNWYVDDQEQLVVTEEAPTMEELKQLHKLIKKIEEDIERLSFNTCIPAFMNFLREMSGCHKRAIKSDFLRLFAPFAPHICEELFEQMGGSGSILDAGFPKLEEHYLVESSYNYPVQINGKLRANIDIELDTPQQEVEQIVLAHPDIQKWLEGKTPKKIVLVPKRIVNVVV